MISHIIIADVRIYKTFIYIILWKHKYFILSQNF